MSLNVGKLTANRKCSNTQHNIDSHTTSYLRKTYCIFLFFEEGQLWEFAKCKKNLKHFKKSQI